MIRIVKRIINPIRKVILLLFKPIAVWYAGCHEPVVLFRFDGGTCSQMAQYLCYKYIERQGVRVLADMSWFKWSNKGKNSPLARPFNIDKLFNLEKIDVASRFLSWIYRNYFAYIQTEEDLQGRVSVMLDKGFIIPEAPCFLSGYYWLSNLQEQIDLYGYLKDTNEIIGEADKSTLDSILKAKKSVGVHVRRGDMAYLTENSYWKIIPKEYFINVCKMEEFSDATFFFFSEEPEWIIENIVPFITAEYRVVQGNSSYYGYRDLFLLSKCKYQVVSQGSFGKWAYALNKNEGKGCIKYDENEPNLYSWVKGNVI